MKRIGHGIDVYYEKDQYTVLFMNERVEEYSVGGMIFEMISDESFYIMLLKSRNAIKSFPDFDELLNPENLKNGFRWLCELTEDENLPIVTEIFQSCFSEIIYELLDSANAKELDNISVGQFLLRCYEGYKVNITFFATCIEANAEVNSGSEDVFWKQINIKFRKIVDEFYEIYKKKCKVRRKNRKTTIEFVNIQTPIELLLLDFCRMKKNNRIIKQCENCGRLFIPQKRNDTIFCMEQSPQNPNKTCKEIGAQERKKLKITIDPLEKNRHREYSKWSMAIKRARERGEDETYYLKKLEEVIRRD